MTSNWMRCTIFLSSPLSTATLILSQTITVLVHARLSTFVQTQGVLQIFMLTMAATGIPAVGLLSAAYMRKSALPFSLPAHLRQWIVYSVGLNLLALFAWTSINSIRTETSNSTWVGFFAGGLCLGVLTLGAFSSWLSLDSHSVETDKLR